MLSTCLASVRSVASTIASMIGARGLGLEVLLAINRIEIGRGFESGLCIVFLAIVIDRITFAMSARKTN